MPRGARGPPGARRVNVMSRSTGNRTALARALAGESRTPSSAAILFIVATYRKAGSIELAAHDLEVATRTLNRWIADYPALRKAIDVARRSL